MPVGDYLDRTEAGGGRRDLPSVDGIIPWLGAGLCEKEAERL